MRLIRVCVVTSLLVFALNPACYAVVGPDETPVVTGDSEEQEGGQTDSNEEPECD